MSERTEDGADAAVCLGDGAAHERAGRVVQYGEAVDGQVAALDRLLQDAADVDALDAIAAEALRPVRQVRLLQAALLAREREREAERQLVARAHQLPRLQELGHAVNDEVEQLRAEHSSH